MTWQGWATLVIVAVVVGLLARGARSPALTMLLGVVAVVLLGIVSAPQAFSGFSNPAPITVAALFIIAGGIEKTGALQPLVAAVFGRTNGERRSLLRLLSAVAASSAAMNNTPIVAMLSPQVAGWAQRQGRSPSRYLMPLSFAAILGGLLTLIGTSTNVVVSGLLESAGMPALGMFEMTPVGLPIAVAGLALLVLATPALLPDRRGSSASAGAEAREFVVQMAVERGGRLDGVGVEEGGLRHLQGLFLVGLERDGERSAPIAPTTKLRGGDLLAFVGVADAIAELQRMRGLTSAEARHFLDFTDPGNTFFEAVVGGASPLVGRTLKEAGFRDRYQAAVVAIHRAGARVHGKLGGEPLRLGDTLLLLADPGFRARWRDRADFLLVSRLGGPSPSASRYAPLAALIALGVVAVAGLGLAPVLHAALAGAALTILVGILTTAEARGAVSLDVLIVIAAGFGLGAAVQESGLAAVIADTVLAPLGALGAPWALAGVVLVTLALTELITNTAAAILVFPVALAVAGDVGADPRAFAIAVALAASCSFLSPLGYQTNTMVYGPGGYRFGDYARLGAPLTILVVITIVGVFSLLGWV
ncbi:MAG: SLC13 family permease [Gemmatimonadota bacterium]